MRIGEGKVFKHKLTGQLYKVKAIKNEMLILESLEPPNLIWFGGEDVGIFFEEMEESAGSIK